MCKYCEIKPYREVHLFSVDVLNEGYECEGGIDVAIAYDPDDKATPYYLTTCIDTEVYSMTDLKVEDCAIYYCPMCGRKLIE